mgnify:CR=1 FL=1
MNNGGCSWDSVFGKIVPSPHFPELRAEDDLIGQGTHAEVAGFHPGDHFIEQRHVRKLHAAAERARQ